MQAKGDNIQKSLTPGWPHTAVTCFVVAHRNPLITAWNKNESYMLDVVEYRCIGIAEVMVSNPVQAWMFSGFFHNCLNCVHYYDEPLCLYNVNALTFRALGLNV